MEQPEKSTHYGQQLVDYIRGLPSSPSPVRTGTIVPSPNPNIMLAVVKLEPDADPTGETLQQDFTRLFRQMPLGTRETFSVLHRRSIYSRDRLVTYLALTMLPGLLLGVEPLHVAVLGGMSFLTLLALRALNVSRDCATVMHELAVRMREFRERPEPEDAEGLITVCVTNGVAVLPILKSNLQALPENPDRL